MAHNPLHLALLKLSEKIGRALRETEDGPIPYPEAVDLLASLEDELSAIANRVSDSQHNQPDDAYERAAARARSNDFEETGGKDWT